MLTTFFSGPSLSRVHIDLICFPLLDMGGKAREALLLLT